MSLPVRVLRAPSRRLWVWIGCALVSSGLGACERFTNSTAPVCSKVSACAGEEGSGGAGPSLSNGGTWAEGGIPNEAGRAGQAGQAGSGWGGEPIGPGGAPNSISPEVVAVRVGGRAVPLDGPLLGVSSDATIEVEFNVDMNMETVIYAYSSANLPISKTEVTYDKVDSRRLSIIPSLPLSYPDVEDAASGEFTFALSNDAESSTGLPLAQFSASFAVFKRAHQLLPVDLKRSSGRIEFGADSVKSGFHEEGNCPVSDYPPEFRAENSAGFVATGRDGSVALYSYPLDPLLHSEVIEQATLTLGKWPYAYWADDLAIYPTLSGDLDGFPFRVSALADGPLSANQASEQPLGVLKTTSNETSEEGFGLFEFDVAGLLKEALTSEEQAVAFRLEFDTDQDDYPLQVCAALLLDVTYLVE